MEISNWDNLILAAPDEGNALRRQANIDRTSRQGLPPVHLIVDGVATTAFRVEVKPFDCFWLVIGPAVETVGQLVAAAKGLAALAAEHGVAAVRVRSQLAASDDSARILREAGLTRVPPWTPDHTIVIDLSGSAEDALARARGRHR